MTYSLYSFPNDVHIFWTLMIVTYPFLSGLIAGSYIASSLYHVFGRKELAPVSRFSLLLSFSFMACAPLPLLFHLGHPERAFNIFITPNYRSAISMFGIVYALYFIILALQIWLLYRPDIIHCRNHSSGWRRGFWGFLALGVYDVSRRSLEVDARIVRFLGIIGLPVVCAVTGYVGFLFGSLKSNPWWSTPLMPHIFVFSAFQSGLACLILLYLFLGWIGVMERSYDCLKTLCFYLWFSIIFYFMSESLELLHFFYESSDYWLVIATLLTTKLKYSFIVLQVCIGVGVPLTILTLTLFFKKWENTFATMAAISCVFALFEVWMMRWNIVIGGQLLSKSFVGFRDYHPHWFEREGIFTAIVLTLLPLVVLFVLSVIFNLKAVDDELIAEVTLERR